MFACMKINGGSKHSSIVLILALIASVISFSPAQAGAQVAGYQQAVLASGPSAYFTFDAGFPLFDVVDDLPASSVFNASVTSESPLSSGQALSTGQLEGSGGIGVLGLTPEARAAIAPTELTVEYWFTKDGDSFASTVNMSEPGYGVFNSRDDIRGLIQTSDGGFSLNVPTNSVSDGEWHHFAMTYSATEERLRIYLDGVIAASRPATGLITYDTFYLEDEGISFFVSPTSLLDEVAIYDRPLSAAEVQSHFNARNSEPTNSGFLGSFQRPFDELWGLDTSSGQFAYADDPVQLASGNFVLVEVDLPFGEQIFGMDFGRTHNSSDDSEGPLGRGWSTSHNMTLAPEADGVVSVRSGDGRILRFVPTADGYTRPDAFYGELTENGDGSFSIEMFDGGSWDFNLDGTVARLQNWDGQTVDVNYADGQISQLVSASGLTVALSYTNGRLSSATASDGRSVTYQYDGNSNLSAVVNPEGEVTTFANDDNGLITQITDPTGAIVVENVYNDLDVVVEQRTGSGEVAAYTYDYDARVTTVSYEPTGEVYIYEFDELGRTTAITDSLGERVEWFEGKTANWSLLLAGVVMN